MYSLFTEDAIKMRTEELFRAARQERFSNQFVARKSLAHTNLLNGLGNIFISVGQKLRTQATSL